MPNSPFLRQQNPAALLRRCSRKSESCLLQECCPALSAGSLYDLRTCREALRTLERKGNLVTPKPSSCPSISYPKVTLGLCAMAPRGTALNGLCRREEQGSTLGFASCRAGWLSANQTRKIHFFSYISRVIVQPSRTEKGHGTKHKVRKKYFMD